MNVSRRFKVCFFHLCGLLFAQEKMGPEKLAKLDRIGGA